MVQFNTVYLQRSAAVLSPALVTRQKNAIRFMKHLRTLLFVTAALALCKAFASSSTPWETYIASPTQQNPKEVQSIEYLEGMDNQRLGEQITADLKILAIQVFGTDSDAFLLTQQAMRSTKQGGSLDDLAEIAGRCARQNPRAYIESAYGQRNCRGAVSASALFAFNTSTERRRALTKSTPGLTHLSRCVRKNLREFAAHAFPNSEHDRQHQEAAANGARANQDSVRQAMISRFVHMPNLRRTGPNSSMSPESKLCKSLGALRGGGCRFLVFGQARYVQDKIRLRTPI
ncbi:MAG: hypothetical protein C4K60_12950 [Ideonella sp. MAG2]|nr:MAG: hypothetical protein C4K60_12950 [Ideonella sp. MAG2]